MGKDKTGAYHPPKGRPSGAGKEEGLGFEATPPEKMEEYLEITDKYTLDADELDPSVPLRHPNRNTSKGEGTHERNDPKSDKAKNLQFTAEDRTNTVPEELPGQLNKEIFAELANYKTEGCISLYFDTHAAGVEVNEHFDTITFKNALQDVAQKLKAKGIEETVIKRTLEPGYDLLKSDDFWNQLSPGLAIFIADGYFKFIKMPVSPNELTFINSSFYVGPLTALMSNKEYFYLLVISKHKVKLFRADAYGMQHVPVELPNGIDEVKRLSGLDATTFRTGSAGKRANPHAETGVYHGTGGGNPSDKDNIQVYFEAVDDLLWDAVFNKENAPLVLAGVEYEIPIYRSVCDYHNVWDQALTGSREHQETGALYKEAKELMQPYFEQRLTKALEIYGNQSTTGLTSSIAADVIPAAYYGQVSHLFVCKGEHIWGTFDDTDMVLNFHDTSDEGGEDLLDKAVIKTILNGGEVFVIDKERMPAESQVAALMRY